MLVRPLPLALVLALASLAAPSAAHARTGGAAAPEAGTVALDPGTGGTLGRVSRLAGTAPAGRVVAVERLEPLTAVWTRVATATAAPDGTFVARWRPAVVGRQRMRALATGGDGDGAGASASGRPPAEVAVTVYRRVLATYYGPGFYGRRTACGHRMSRKLLGVAHKKLPCGTQVAIRHRSATIVVPVVDRGPFRPGTSYDLTAATAAAVGFDGLARIGAVALRDEPPAPPPPDQPSR
jgi:hypothetical protein